MRKHEYKVGDYVLWQVGTRLHPYIITQMGFTIGGRPYYHMRGFVLRPDGTYPLAGCTGDRINRAIIPTREFTRLWINGFTPPSWEYDLPLTA